MGNRQPICAAVLAALALTAPGFASPSAPTMAEMQWHRRVLIVSTPRASDPQFSSQQRALAAWAGSSERDVTVVWINDGTVTGSREKAADLRQRYGLADSSFAVALVGKDGHVALRSEIALTGAQLEAAIDAMPMRKAGQR